MARSKDLKVNITGDADKLDRELRKSGKTLDKFGKQTRLTSSITSKGFAGMRATAVGATAAFGGLALAGKSVAQASIEAEAATAKVKKMVENAGISWKKHGKQIDEVIQKHSQLTGIDDEELAESFANMVRTTGNLNEAFKLNALAADISRSKGVGLAQAQSLLARVYNGAYTGLKRLGIAFEPTTAAQDKLKASTKNATDEQERAAKQADKTANRQTAIAALQKAFGGQAETYGKTTAGSIDRAKVAFENLEETVGDALAPTIEKTANKVADFVNEMQDGTGQGGRFVEKLKDIWSEAKPIVTWIGRATKNVADFVGEHPAVGKLALAIIGVGTAVKGLKFVSAVTGFSSLLSAGGVAARGLKTILGRGGTAAGAAAAENAAASMGTSMGPALDRHQKSITGGKSGGRWGKMGKYAGRAFGIAVVAGLLIGYREKIEDTWQKIKDDISGRNQAGDEDVDLPDSGTLSTPRSRRRDAAAARRRRRRSPANRRALGGIIPGTGNGDTVPAMLTPGEFVIRKRVVEKFGPTFFAAINEGKAPQMRARGGVIGPQTVSKMQSAARGWVGLPYVYGGGHGSFGPSSGGFDCSGFVSAILGIGGSIGSPMAVRQPLQGALARGPGKYVTVGIRGSSGRNAHCMIKVGSRYFESSSNGVVESGGWRGSFDLFHPLNEAKDGGKADEDPGQAPGSGSGGSATGPTKSERAARAGSRLVNRIAAKTLKGVSRDVRAQSAIGQVIEDAEGGYGRSERFFGQVIGGQAGVFGEEDLGTAEGRTARISELEILKGLKVKQLARMRKRASALKRVIAKYEKALKQMGKARAKAKGAKRAKISDRMKAYDNRLVDYKAELRGLGESISDTELDIGDLTKDIGEVAATPDNDAPETPTPTDTLAGALGSLDLQERAGVITPESATAQRISYLQRALAGEFGPLSQNETWDVMGQLRDAQGAATQAITDLTSQLADLKGSIDEQTNLARSIIGTENFQLTKSLADILSGHIAGYGVAGRALTPGSGALARY